MATRQWREQHQAHAVRVHLQVWLTGYGTLALLGFASIAYKEPRLLPTSVTDAMKGWGFPVGAGYRPPVRHRPRSTGANRADSTAVPRDGDGAQ